ncbi:MAG: hypothetical protein R3F61_29210 [Myxococcota bacterium]
MLALTVALAGPLAIPADPETPSETPPAPAPRPEPAPTRPPAPQPDRSVAYAEYRERWVSVRSYQTFSGGGARVVGGWGYGWPGFGSPYIGMSTGYVLRDPLVVHDRWAVYQGRDRLTVPMWMDLADAPEQRDALRRRIRRTRAWNGTFLGLAIAGGVTAVGASYGSRTAGTYEEFDDWNLVASGGLTALVGAIGAYASGMHARTLRYDFDATQDLRETHRLVEAHNAALRDELGLTAAEAERLEGAPR